MVNGAGFTCTRAVFTGYEARYSVLGGARGVWSLGFEAYGDAEEAGDVDGVGERG